MEWIMCLSCGEFVAATNDDGTWTPLRDECPSCESREFKHVESGTEIRTGE